MPILVLAAQLCPPGIEAAANRHDGPKSETIVSPSPACGIL